MARVIKAEFYNPNPTRLNTIQSAIETALGVTGLRFGPNTVSFVVSENVIANADLKWSQVKAARASLPNGTKYSAFVYDDDSGALVLSTPRLESLVL